MQNHASVDEPGISKLLHLGRICGHGSLVSVLYHDPVWQETTGQECHKVLESGCC